MATSPAADVLVTGAPGDGPTEDFDDFITMDVPDEEKDSCLLIESSKTVDLSVALRCDTDAPLKRKKTRRGKKKQRHGPGGGSTGAEAAGIDGATAARSDGDPSVAAAAAGTAEDDAAPPVPGKKPRLNRRQRRRRSGRHPAPILRPLEVPRAPLNSTSFIIDDHENSAFYIDFDAAARRTPNGPSDGGSQLESSTADDEDEEEAAYQFSMKDFENVYRHAREEELCQLERTELVQCVRSLEARVRELENQLTLYDPEVWVTNLQNQLLHLQEENTLLKKTREALVKKYGNET